MVRAVSATDTENGVETNGPALADDQFPWRLNVRMIARDRTVPELSEKSGVPTRTIERWLSGTHPPGRTRHSLDSLHAVARDLRTSALFLLTGERK